MALVTMSKYDEMMMSLVHYFVTKENYTPIHVQGAKDEIWLENVDGPYRVIRINYSSIINDEQYEFEIFKMQHIIKQIKRKTLSFKVNALNICLKTDDRVNLDRIKNIESIKIDSLNDIRTNDELTKAFPTLKEELIEAKDNLDLIINVTNDINDKTEKDNKLFSKIFSPKRIIVTYLLIIACIIMFALTYILGNGSEDKLTLVLFGANFLPLVKAGEIWRLITCAFLHIGIIHLVVNMYSLFTIGSQVESFMGKLKFIIIYLVSAISASLLSLVFGTSISAGASGAIFGLMGSLLYFGYHYRLYLNDALRTQIIPVIILNLLIGFMNPLIDNAAHIGGLIGGYLITMALGLEGKSKTSEKINGWIVTVLYIGFLSFIVFFVK